MVATKPIVPIYDGFIQLDVSGFIQLSESGFILKVSDTNDEDISKWADAEEIKSGLFALGGHRYFKICAIERGKT